MRRGFTLIELLVSVAIFTVVMVISLGALLAVAESDRKAQTLKTITNNLGFALDSMSRNIRTGYDWGCGSSSSWPPAEDDCPSGGVIFGFVDIDGDDVGYRHHTTVCENGVGCLQRSNDGGANWTDITAPEVIVNSATFYLAGSPRDDNMQPRVTISVIGYVQITDVQESEFKIQTTVTQRLYDQ